MSKQSSFSLSKRFWAAIIFCVVILLITFLSPPVAPADHREETVVLQADPEFDKYRDGSSWAYRILFHPEGKTASWTLSGADLDLADRAGIKAQIHKGDRVTIAGDYFYVIKLIKDGKEYTNSEAAYQSGLRTNRFVIALSLTGLVLGFIILFLIKPRKGTGWIAFVAFSVFAVLLWLLLGVTSSSPASYSEFN